MDALLRHKETYKMIFGLKKPDLGLDCSIIYNIEMPFKLTDSFEEVSKLFNKKD